MGGVFSGIFTPTESAVIATVYAFLLAVFVYHEITFKKFLQVAGETAVSSCIIMMIISVANPFGWVLTMRNIPSMVADFILSLTNNTIVVYLLIFILLVFWGTFMEGFSIVILTTPIFLPVLTDMGVDPIAYGAVLAMSMAIGGVTPPLAVCLFTSCRILKMRVEETLPAVFWVLGIMIFITALIIFFPGMATFLVSLSA